MTTYCSKCGRPLAEDAQFCSSCGAVVAGSPVQESPETPLVARNLFWAWVRKSKLHTALTIAVVCVTVLLLAGLASGPAPAKTYGPKVSGSVNNDLLAGIGSDSEALANLQASNVWCQWSGDSVHQHITLANNLGAHVTVTISPSYHLENAGTHGDGSFDEHDAGVDANALRQWDGDLGHPSGVSGHPLITSCDATIEGVSTG